MVSRTVVFSLLVLGAISSYAATIIFVYLFIKYTLLKSQTSIEVQAALKFYIMIEILNGFVVCFSLTHNCLVYNIEDPVIYVTQLLFWDVALQNIVVIIRPLAIFILGLDKLFIVFFPTTAEYKRKMLSFFIGISLMLITIVLFLAYRILPSIPTEVFTTSCVSFNCVGRLGSSSMYFATKTVFGIMDFILGMILLILLNKRFKMMSVVRMKNKNMTHVILTLFITIVLDFLPNLTGFLFLMVNYSIFLYLIRRISDNRS